MTGIERLREFAEGISPFTVVCGVTTTSYDRKHTEVEGARLRHFLSDIADQIEREHDAEVAESPYDAILPEDRDAIAWVREHGGLEAVRRRWECLSYYADPVPRSCMEKRLARLQRQIDESHAALRRRRGIISELNHRACDLTREIAQMRKRLMPDGMCWPVFEDGEPVRIGDFVSDVEVRSVVFRDGGILLSDCTSVPGWGTWRSYKEPIKRPSKVLDADGVEIRVGDRVWSTQLDGPHEWIVIDPHEDRDDSQTVLVSIGDRTGHARPENLTHQRPSKVLDADGVEIHVGDTVYHVKDGSEMTVYGIEGEWLVVSVGSRARHDTVTHRAPVLAADGRPLREEEHVYHVETGTELVVKKLPKPGEYQAVVVFALPTSPASHLTSFDPDRLTHERPVLDAGGVPIREGDTVYNKVTGEPGTAIVVDNDGQQFATVKSHDRGNWCDPLCFTHTKPEPPDSWERIEEDAGCTATKYNERRGTIFTTKQQVARDLVRRCRALAERERGE